MLVLPKSWRKRWQTKDVFDQLATMKGRVYREREGRKTVRLTIDDNYYFVKIHRGIGWKEIIKNLFHFRLPVISAKNEWLAIQRLNQLGVNTARLVGYGEKGWNPARLQSFIVTEELANTISLEDYCRKWHKNPPNAKFKRILIAEIAKISRLIHDAGLNHRDYYICHFLLDLSCVKNEIEPDRLRLYLIDLHRMQIRQRTPMRWRVKDIAALYYSSMNLGLTNRDLMRYIRIYKNKPLKETFKKDRIFWDRVKKRADSFYREGLRKNLV